MPLYVGDYLADTTHLTAGEDGAYMRLLMCMWRAGGSLPEDDVRLARFCKLTPAQWQRVKPAVMEFFTVSEGVITQRRLSRELQKHTAAVFQRREAGSRGGQAKALKDKETVLAVAMPSPCQPEPEPEPEPEKKETDTAKAVSPSAKPRQSPAGFDEFWEAYPRKVGKLAALTAWKRLKPPLVPALAAIARYRQTKPADIDFCHPATWLNQGRWMDEHGEARVTGPAATWTGPPEIRARVAMEQTDAFARSYLDPAEWTPDGIRPANGYAFDKLRHLRSLKDVKLLQPQERAA